MRMNNTNPKVMQPTNTRQQTAASYAVSKEQPATYQALLTKAQQSETAAGDIYTEMDN